jgi:hypothetical protein
MLDNYRDLIDELLETPTELRQLVGGRSEPVPAGAAKLLVELRARDQAVLERLQAMRQRPDAYLRAIAPVTAPAPGAEADVAAVLAAFDTARGELVALLMNLTLRDWERTAIHETEGEVRLVDLVEQHVDFDEEQVRRLREHLA